jgi:hypothetical protein
MDLKTLRAQCTRRLAGLEIPDPFDIGVLCDNVAALRGRPLHVLELPEGGPKGMPCGMWMGTHDADFIWYDASTSRAHADHIIAHELAHMLCDHFGPADEVFSASLAPQVAPSTVKLMLGRTRYDTEQEREAELLASLLTAPAAVAPEVDGPVLSRLQENLFAPMRNRRIGRAR